MNDAAVLAALLRSDLRFFLWKSFQTILPGTAYLPNWHVDAIVHHLMRVHAGDISRLLINQPPRSLKSICVCRSPMSHGFSVTIQRAVSSS
jgi:hypothetical protein